MSAKRRVHRALRDAGSRGCTTGELSQPDCGGIRFGARLNELRAEGVDWTRQREAKGSWRYRLVRAVETQATVTRPTGPEAAGSAPGSPEPSLFPDTVGRRNPMFDTEEAA